MNNINLIIVPILLPLFGGALIPLFHFKSRLKRSLYVETLVIINSIFVFMLLFAKPEGRFMAVNLAGALEIVFKLDGAAMIFSALVAFLWPFASLYAFEYMKHEGGENKFFTFYTMTYGITLGIAFAENFMTLYMFYEMLTLITLPIVMHSMTRKAILAGRKYAFYSIGGAAFAFIGFIFTFRYGNTMEFTYGGVLNMQAISGKEELLRAVYVLAVLGFGVKAAIFPFHGWLPTVSIAPTPVTALLHAVAVVKAGAFAIIRITYYIFGTEFLKDTWAQTTVLIFVAITIFYCSSKAVKEQHLKRRLAYSTSSNLSYVLFGVLTMTPYGLVGGFTHMVFHGIMKITLFFAVGAVLYKTNKEYVYEINGFGKKMPVVFLGFTVSALALIGIPPLAGFISKWELARGAVLSENNTAKAVLFILIISAFLTAIYLFTIIIRAYFPKKDFDYSSIEKVEDPNWLMKLPIIILAVLTIIIGVYSKPLIDFFTKTANGLI